MGEPDALQEENVHTVSGQRLQQFAQIAFAARVERRCGPELPGELRGLGFGALVAGQRCRQQQMNSMLPGSCNHPRRQPNRASEETSTHGSLDVSRVQDHEALSPWKHRAAPSRSFSPGRFLAAYVPL